MSQAVSGVEWIEVKAFARQITEVCLPLDALAVVAGSHVPFSLLGLLALNGAARSH